MRQFHPEALQRFNEPAALLVLQWIRGRPPSRPVEQCPILARDCQQPPLWFYLLIPDPKLSPKIKIERYPSAQQMTDLDY